MHILGIDIGGTGIKGAPVDTETGKLLAERFRIPTPQPATPQSVAAVVRQLVTHFKWKGPVGCAFPAVVKNGVTYTAANVDKSWIGCNAEKLFQKVSGQKVVMINDADAAGLAEVRFGAARLSSGVVMMITLGTGIGSGFFVNKKLVPNTELGHLIIRGKDAERRASDRAREKKDLSWKKWAKNVNEYLNLLDSLLYPDLIVIGGGVSKQSEKFFPFLKTRVKVVPALLLNDAGIIGAALAAKDKLENRS